jgi:hypothetical protein
VNPGTNHGANVFPGAGVGTMPGIYVGNWLGAYVIPGAGVGIRFGA